MMVCSIVYAWWVHSINLLRSMIIHKILNNIPNFTKYWKIPPKIILLNPPRNTTFQLRKPLVSPYIVGIQFYQPIFNTLFITYHQVLTNKRPNTS